MLTLWDTVVDDFETRDRSRDRVVTRSARRLIDQGFVVPMVRVSARQKIDFDWGHASIGYRDITEWSIDFFDQKESSVRFSGTLKVTEEKVTHSILDRRDVNQSPRDTCDYTFSADRIETERRLKLNSKATKAVMQRVLRARISQ